MAKPVFDKGKPTQCGRCGERNIATAPERDVTWDPDPGVWVGFVACPDCRAIYIFMRKEARCTTQT